MSDFSLTPIQSRHSLRGAAAPPDSARHNKEALPGHEAILLWEYKGTGSENSSVFCPFLGNLFFTCFISNHFRLPASSVFFMPLSPSLFFIFVDDFVIPSPSISVISPSPSPSPPSLHPSVVSPPPHVFPLLSLLLFQLVL